MLVPTDNELLKAVKTALAEDVGAGDATSDATIPGSLRDTAQMVVRESMTLAGQKLAELAFNQVDSAVRVQPLAADGDRLERGARIMSISGPARALLTAERVALNFVQRLSGVATATARYVKAVKHTKVRILDTRKTTPGWRRLEKYAVACGGGTNHRIGLFDLIMIKDNHLAALREAKPNAVAAAVARSREKFPELKVEVEADHLRQVEQAVEAGADIILLDNMSLEDLRAAVELVDGRAQTEASGGVTLDTVSAIAETGVDFISVGAITHSVRAVDIGLDFAD